MNDLKHYGVLGMRWGKRRAAGSVTSVSVGRGSLGRAKELAGLGVDAIRDDFNKAKSFTSKVVKSKAFKTLIYDKDNITGFIFNKREVERLKASTKKIGNFLAKQGVKLRENFQRHNVRTQDRDIKLMREIADGLKKSTNLKDKRLAKEYADTADWLEKDLNDTFTPEELKKYRGG